MRKLDAVGVWGAIVAAGLVGCQPKEVTVNFEQPGCADYSFSDPAEEDYTIEVGTDGDVVVSHLNTIQSCDTSFEPDVTVADKVITVREYWIAGSGTECETCFSPEVVLEGVPRGRYELRWFIEGDDYPIFLEEFKVE